ncbi:hypothetical protein BDV12DRAFT_179762 [Aspergillus spectabilis]
MPVMSSAVLVWLSLAPSLSLSLLPWLAPGRPQIMASASISCRSVSDCLSKRGRMAL